MSSEDLEAFVAEFEGTESPPMQIDVIAAKQILRERKSKIEQNRHDDLFLQSERSLSISRKAFRISIWATIIAIIAIAVSIKEQIFAFIFSP